MNGFISSMVGQGAGIATSNPEPGAVLNPGYYNWIAAMGAGTGGSAATIFHDLFSPSLSAGLSTLVEGGIGGFFEWYANQYSHPLNRPYPIR